MYVWQMNDGTWRISLMTGQGGRFSKILACQNCLKLYDAAYCDETAARGAERVIRAHLAAGAVR